MTERDSKQSRIWRSKELCECKQGRSWRSKVACAQFDEQESGDAVDSREDMVWDEFSPKVSHPEEAEDAQISTRILDAAYETWSDDYQ